MMDLLKKFGELDNQKWILLVTIILGFLFRVYDIRTLNLYPDEGVFYFAVKSYLYDNVSAWLSQSWQPPLHTWINSLFVLIFGLNEFSIRFSSAIFGTLTVIIIYHLAKLWYGKKEAILAAALLAFLPVHVIYSRTAFSDVMQTFFLLAAILFAEIALIKNNRKYLMLSLSGVLFSLSFLIKYNSIVLWALYWVVILAYSIFKKEKASFKKTLIYTIISNFAGLITILIVILSSGGVERLIYAVNNFIFLTVMQSSVPHNAIYFHFVVLIEALSPILALMLPIAISYLLMHKKRTRSDFLLASLVLVFYAIITYQQRRYVRHQMIMIPLLVIILSRFLLELLDNIKIKKYSTVFFTLILTITAAWSIYEINKINDYKPWSELANFLKTYYPNAKLHASPTISKVVKYYILDVDVSGSIEQLKKDDFVVFMWLYNDTVALGHYPMDEQMIFYPKRHYQEDYTPIFTKYVLKNGKLIKTFEFKNRPTMWLYQIQTTSPYEEYTSSIRGLGDYVKLSGMWSIICKGWNNAGITKNIMQILLSKQQLNTVKNRCNT